MNFIFVPEELLLFSFIKREMENKLKILTSILIVPALIIQGIGASERNRLVYNKET